MKSIKIIKKQAIKAAQISFRNGELDEAAVKKFVKAFKGLPLNESILTLNHYLRALKSELNKTTLIIESAAKLSASQVKEVKDAFAGYKVKSVTEQLSPSILGGIKVRIGDVIWDGSVKERLEQVKQAITS